MDYQFKELLEKIIEEGKEIKCLFLLDGKYERMKAENAARSFICFLSEIDLKEDISKYFGEEL